MLVCKSGKHTWFNATCARRCCNGFHQELRNSLDFALDGSEKGGEVFVDGEDLKYVWVKDKEK